MIRKRRTKFTTILMSICLMTGLALTMPGMSTKVQSADPPIPSPQFATKQDLLASFDLDNYTVDKSVAKVLFGQDGSGKAQEWYIAGKDPRSTNQNGLVLFAASPLKTEQRFDEHNGSGTKPYDDFWGCIYEAFPKSVYINHYGGSELRTVLKGLEKDSTYFSKSEQDKMLPTIIKTEDFQNGFLYTTSDKLYAASVASLPKMDAITVGVGGSGVTIGGALIIHLSNLSGDSEFWSRQFGPSNHLVLTAHPDSTINENGKAVTDELAVQPAFELNLESLLFASTVPAATTEGPLTAGEAFTLRYDAGTSFGTASINPSQTNVAVKSMSSGTYLMVQNSTGAWAKPVNGETDIPASQVTIGGTVLSSYDGCKVWLETTDKDRITKATAAAQETASVSITAGKNMTLDSGSTEQTDIIGAMTDVVYLADTGYYFPENYQVASVSGIQVTRINASQIKVWGSPETKNVNITLSNSEKKGTPEAPSVTGGVEKITGTTSDMEYADSDIATTWTACADKETPVEAGTWYVRFKETDSTFASPAAKVEVAATTYTIEASPKEGLTFDTVNEGYTQPDAKTVTVKNTGNSPVTLNQPATTSRKFTISALSKTGLDAGETATFTVQPVTKLTEGTYNETIEITTGQNTKAAIDISFKVNKAPAEAPKITKGMNGVWTKGSKDGLTFQSDSPFEEFKYVLVDNKKTASSNYTVKPGSTIVTLKPEYLETLSEGKHTIAIVSENGTAEASFTIAKKGTSVPETGDNNSLYLLLAMLLLSGTCFTVMVLRAKSNKY